MILMEKENCVNKLERDFDHKARDGDFKEFKFNKQGFWQFWKIFSQQNFYLITNLVCRNLKQV